MSADGGRGHVHARERDRDRDRAPAPTPAASREAPSQPEAATAPMTPISFAKAFGWGAGAGAGGTAPTPPPTPPPSPLGRPVAASDSAPERAADAAEARQRGAPDLTGVRVHTDARADGYARSLGADALTLGQDIFVARAAWNPGSAATNALLAHELHHAHHGQAGVVYRKTTGGAGGAPTTVASPVSSSDSWINGRTPLEVVVETRRRATKLLGSVPAMVSLAVAAKTREVKWYEDRGMGGHFVHLFNSIPATDPARWDEVISRWKAVRQLLEANLAIPDAAENLQVIRAAVDGASRAYKDAVLFAKSKAGEFENYRTGFSDSVDTVALGAELTATIAFVTVAVYAAGPTVAAAAVRTAAPYVLSASLVATPVTETVAASSPVITLVAGASAAEVPVAAGVVTEAAPAIAAAVPGAAATSAGAAAELPGWIQAAVVAAAALGSGAGSPTGPGPGGGDGGNSKPLTWVPVTVEKAVTSGGVPGALEFTTAPRTPATWQWEAHHCWPKFMGGPEDQPLMGARHDVHQTVLHPLIFAGLRDKHQLLTSYTSTNREFIARVQEDADYRRRVHADLSQVYLLVTSMTSPVLPKEAWERGLDASRTALGG